MTTDALILGSGPAGLAIARALAARGLSTAVVAPDPHQAWPATYGSWTDHLPDYVRPAAAAQYATAWVHLDGPALALERGYSRLDTASLQRILVERALEAGVQLIDASCRSVDHDPNGTTVHAGSEHRCAVLVDASGRGVALGAGQPTLFQTAFGVLAETDAPIDGLRWMDFSHRFGDGTEAPTFLYAMPYPDGRTFLEETSLAHDGGLSFEQLESRLRERLAALGIGLRRVDEVERVRIALDRPIPKAQRTVGFGAAAGMVHPASGFSLARSLAAAEPLADAIVAGLATGGPAKAASAAWSLLWPADRRHRWGLYRYGARLVGRFGADHTRTFFGAFFRGSRWGEWLDDELSSTDLAREMMAHFSRLPPGPRWHVLRGSLSALLVRGPEAADMEAR